MIIVNNKICQLQPLFPECWKKRHLLAIAHVKSHDGRPRRLILFVHYSNPRAREACDLDFDFLMRNLKAKYPQDIILSLGDFNRSRAEMQRLAATHQLQLTTLTGNIDYTREQRLGLRTVRSELDYILCYTPSN